MFSQLYHVASLLETQVLVELCGAGAKKGRDSLRRTCRPPFPPPGSQLMFCDIEARAIPAGNSHRHSKAKHA